MNFVHRLCQRKYLLITLCFILLINLSLFLNDTNILFASLIIIPLCFTFYLLFFNNQILLYLLAFLVPLSIPVNIIYGSQISFPSEIIIVILTVFIFVKNIHSFSFNKKKLFHPLTILILIHICWVAIACVFSSIPLVSFKRLFLLISFITVFYFGFANAFKHPDDYLKIFFIYVIGTVVPVIVALFFLYHHNFRITADTQMTKPFFTDHAILGACMAFVTPFIIIKFFNSKGKIKLFTFILFLIVLVGLIFSYSRAAWISLCVAGLLYLFVLLKTKMPGLLLMTSGLFFIVFVFRNDIESYLKENKAVSNRDLVQHIQSVGNIKSDASNTERINRWKSAWRMFLERPFTGFGPGTYQFVYGRFQSHNDMTRISTYKGDKGGCHSEYLTSLSETGLPGFIILLAIVFTSIQTSIKNIYHSTGKTRQLMLSAFLGLITFYFHGLFNNFLDSDKIALLVIGSWGIIIWCDIQLTKSVYKKNELKITEISV